MKKNIFIARGSNFIVSIVSILILCMSNNIYAAVDCDGCNGSPSTCKLPKGETKCDCKPCK